MAEDSDGKKSTKATGLLLQVKCFRFLLILVVFDRLLAVTKGLSDALQSKSLDLGKASELVLATVETLEELGVITRGINFLITWKVLLNYI